MDSAADVRSLDEVADLLLECVSQSGSLAGLENATLDAIESETLEKIDQITQSVLSNLLRRQAELTEAPAACPKCGKPLKEKPAQGRSLQSRRGMIHFKCDVFRCEACRLDFFPSVQNPRL